ncbi:DUF642 domain-containing protein [Paucibacter sp. KBW04]|uniref:DUF642 domain-containing protein n=1 Tax=Paucibacter sp. KBW04 TaxID=2153361 RepID=UPI000F56330C|nr:DUF642 domain-containing protein [Paucibacter sp. KBW04]
MQKLILAALLGAPMLAQAAPVNLVQNGSFETIAGGQSGVITLIANSSRLSGWQVGAQGAELRHNTVGQASDGKYFLELDVSKNSSVSQILNTVAGQWYTLSFDYSNRAGTAVNSNGLGWSVGGAMEIAPELAYNRSKGNVWSHIDWSWQATGSSTTLSFYGLGKSDGLGTSLDNIAVTSAVPEPESLALAALGLFFVGLVSRRRKSA